MTERDSFPDEVPVADAAEQDRPVRDSADGGEDAAAGSTGIPGSAPLEADASDWQDQRLVVEIDDEDFR